MEVYRPTFNSDNEKAREKLQNAIDKHIKELKAAYDEYLNADEDKSERRAQELEEYLLKGAGEKGGIGYGILWAIHVAYPKPPKPDPVFAPGPSVPVVKSVAEAKKRGLTSYAIIEEGYAYDVPEEWKDVDWMGASVTEVAPSVSDRNNPARMTEDGKVYYREY